jgi:YHS domain-containing protein
VLQNDTANEIGDHIMKSIFAASGLALMLSLGALAGSTAAVAKPTYTGVFGNVAAGGYDVTAYFAGKGTPQKGDKAFAVTYNGVEYHFANKANADKFKAKPQAFAPQYGGYCSWAMAQGYKAPGDPSAYRVVNGKLYLNYNQSVQEKWVKDIPGFISKGNVEWQKLP